LDSLCYPSGNMSNSLIEEDQVVLVDENGQPLRKSGHVFTFPKLEAHLKGLRHLAVSVFVFDSQGRWLLQRRALDKYHSAGLWSNSSCTHPRLAEAPPKAARRRLSEEMGLDINLRAMFSLSYRVEVGKGLIENEFDYIFFGRSDNDPCPDQSEVVDWKWLPHADLVQNIQQFPEHYSAWFRLLQPEVQKYLML
jgi:isopentenyl-diphosphate delta-isomerase